MGVKHQHFRSGFFEFLAELKANNDREWFNANKQRYVEQVEEPMLAFIADVGEQMRKVSRSFVADPRPSRRFDVPNLSRYALLKGQDAVQTCGRGAVSA